MQLRLLSVGPRLSSLILGAALVGAGCAQRRVVPDKLQPEESVVVQVRDFHRSSTVDILAWAPEENNYGLRSMVRQDGNLVRDHRFYVSALYLRMGFFHNAGATFRPSSAFTGRRFVEMIAPEKQLLEKVGISGDARNCFDWPRCSPFQTGGARVPDSVLRANPDSLTIRFFDSRGDEVVLTLHRAVIGPYLRVVDSVRSALRKS